MIKNIKNFGFTKMVGILSGLLLLCLSAGLFVMSFNCKNMSNTNYALNDMSEKTRFENLLMEQKIPFEKISDNVYGIDKVYKEKADNIFQSISSLPY